MKRILTIATTLCVLACSYPAVAQTIKVNTTRMVVVNEPIGKNVKAHISEIEEMAEKNLKPIYIYLDSPGGSVTAGLFFIHAMEKLQSRGIKFVCVVDELAASMAFQYLAHCDRRYAHQHSAMLWHPVRVNVMMASITPLVARNLFLDLTYIENTMLPVLLTTLKIEKKVFLRHYHAETLHYGHQLNKLAPGFLTVIKGVRNQAAIEKVISDKKKKRTPLQIIFGGSKSPSKIKDLKAYEIDYTFRGEY